MLFLRTRRIAQILLGSVVGVLWLPAQNTVVSNTTYGSGQTLTVVGPTTLSTSSTVVVASGADIDFRATNQIVLSPGFHAASGGLFSAAIAPDSTNPVINNLTSSSITTNSFSVTWTPQDVYLTAYDGVIIAQQIQLNSGTIQSLSGGATSHPFSGLSAGTAYTVKIQAQDAAGRWSGWSLLNVATPSDPNADDDSDGLLNWQEALLGTNPQGTSQNDANNDTQLKIFAPQPNS